MQSTFQARSRLAKEKVRTLISRQRNDVAHAAASKGGFASNDSIEKLSGTSFPLQTKPLQKVEAEWPSMPGHHAQDRFFTDGVFALVAQILFRYIFFSRANAPMNRTRQLC
jgi:hypothetical protein